MPQITITLKGTGQLTLDEEESVRDMVVDYLRLMGIRALLIDDQSLRFQSDLSASASDTIDAGEIELPTNLPSEIGGRVFEHRQMFGHHLMPRMDAVARSIVTQIRSNEIIQGMAGDVFQKYGDEPWELLHDDHIYAGDGFNFVGCVEWPVDGQLLVPAHNGLVPEPDPKESPSFSM